MEFENQINKFPGCQNCQLVKETETRLRRNPEMAKKHIILTQCSPKLGVFGSGYAILIGLITEEGRLTRLKAFHPDGNITFSAPMLEVNQPGNCKPLINKKAEKTTNKILDFLHLS